jgi:hypothetical protein
MLCSQIDQLTKKFICLIMDWLSWLEHRVIAQSKKKDVGLWVRLARQANTTMLGKLGLDKNDLCQILC